MLEGRAEESGSALPREGRPEGEFPSEAKRGVYAAISGRRTVRSFRPDPIPDEVLARLLAAAHRAPSVGFSQPWDFILVRDEHTRGRVRELFGKARRAEACLFDGGRGSEYPCVELDSISTAPLNLCVACDPTRGGPKVLGRLTVPEADLYSACLAVENLWLAARAEGVGVDWVSLLHGAELREVLGIPPHVVPVAYLALGYPKDGFPEKPLLESAGWGGRLPLRSLVSYEEWGRRAHGDWDGLGGILGMPDRTTDDEPSTEGGGP